MKKNYKKNKNLIRCKKLLKEKEQEIEFLKSELERKSTEIEVISQISKAIISGQSIDEILDGIVKLVGEKMNKKICSIMMLDEEKQELVIKATQSLSEEYKKKPNIKVGQGISGLAVKEKTPQMVLDITKDPRYAYPEIAKKVGIVSMLAVPMLIKDKVIGVINVYTSEKHKFTDEEIKVLQTIANQSAVCIENAKLFETTLKVKEELETRKLVERAKGILMKEKNLSEDEAYRIIQKKSMDMRKSMKEIAQAIIISDEIKNSKETHWSVSEK
ncbi:MAG: ANTAR domain-containing protein [Candidatus Omnitrophica bacterium]|nr:ANTAR domain-containing protein [Candidatus Omnitrophota bacterium]